MKRRVFLTTATATASVQSASAAPKLAIDGGVPVRDKPLRAGYWGSEFYDDRERAEVLDVLEAKSPFRWYGPGGPPKKVMEFEKRICRAHAV